MNENVYISEANLKGYKSIVDTRVKFKPGLNIIIGRNGSGKSNLLNILHRNLLLDFDFDNNTKPFRFETKVSNLSSYAIFRGYRGGVLKDNNNVKIDDIDTEIVFNDGKKYSHIRDFFEETRFVFAQTYIPFGLPNNFPLIINPFTFKGGKKSVTSFEIWDIITNNEPNYYIKSMLVDILFSLLLSNQIHSLNIDEYKSRVISIIEKYCSILTNSLQNHTIIKEVRVSKKLYVNEHNEYFEMGNLLFEYLISDVWYNFKDLSDGLKRMVLYISSINYSNSFVFTRNSAFNNENKMVGQIVLAEEPELGIHPHQLYLLMNFLKEQSGSKQIILTTHSPEVLNVLSKDELDRILICEWTPKEGTQLRNMTEKEMQDAHVYMDEVGNLSDYWLHSDFNRI